MPPFSLAWAKPIGTLSYDDYSYRERKQLRCARRLARLTVRRFADLPFWKRAAATNAAAAVGVFIGFASAKYKPPVLLDAGIAVFTFGFMNLMLLVVAPRIQIKRIAGGAAPSRGAWSTRSYRSAHSSPHW